MVRVQVVNEVCQDQKEEGDWVLCLQWCRYFDIENGSMLPGYRFIWRGDKGKLIAARGQARIRSLDDAQELIDRARQAGWGDYRTD